MLADLVILQIMNVFGEENNSTPMESIKEIYKIGLGPSSSHTMGPKTVAEQFLERNVNASRFEVTLYGSLAATGERHMTDRAI